MYNFKKLKNEHIELIEDNCILLYEEKGKKYKCYINEYETYSFRLSIAKVSRFLRGDKYEGNN